MIIMFLNIFPVVLTKCSSLNIYLQVESDDDDDLDLDDDDDEADDGSD